MARRFTIERIGLKLTGAQRGWLLAANGDGLNMDAVWPGSSYLCVQRLLKRGLIEVRQVPMEDLRYFTTLAGRSALKANGGEK